MMVDVMRTRRQRLRCGSPVPPVVAAEFLGWTLASLVARRVVGAVRIHAKGAAVVI